MKFIGIIPARYASSRFPGKPLAMVRGKSMIQRVYEQAIKCTALSDVYVATDHHDIAAHVRGFGKVIMTSEAHQSGTDRCLEAVNLIQPRPDHKLDVVINIQGDEPFIHPLQIELLIGVFANPEANIASLYKVIEQPAELFDENVVKVTLSCSGKAIYFSRHPIPYNRGTPREEWLKKGNYYKHIGIYGYRIHVLQQICAISPGMLEKAESLEQLRWIEHGFSIHMNKTGMQHFAIDTPDDLQKINNCTSP